MLRIVSNLFVPILLFAFIELYLWSELSHALGPDHYLTILYISIAVIGYIGMILGIRYWRKSPIKRNLLVNFLFGFGFATILQKLIFLILSVLLDILQWIISWFGAIDPSILVYLSGITFLLSLLPLLALTYGILWGKYKFQLENIHLKFPDLPASFDGFRILQISDAHSGTWDSIEGVEKGIKLIEKQNADMIVFTGDLVNGFKEEINPFMHLFERLKAPYGKYAVLGNHDYYGQPRERSLRTEYYNDFFKKFEEMGFDLLLNESREVQKGSDSIRLIGVENWGSGRFFPKRGDLDKATQNSQSNEFNILLSHDPSHWDLKALDYPKHFHLTLSGHTHAMQFGINLPFFKWSPVQYRYKRWMGLYKEKDQYLYVNRGFGYLAYPGRVGMSPEITLITLQKS